MKVNISEEMKKKVEELGEFYTKMYEELGGKRHTITVEIIKEPVEDKYGGNKRHTCYRICSK